MKFKLFLLFIVCSGFAAFAQDNPYELFGYHATVVYETKQSEFYRIENKENDSPVKALALNFEEGYVLILGENDSILNRKKVEPDQLIRFLSVDPLTKSYPMLTPYQFASNTPIWAIDLDGLESQPMAQAYMGVGTYTSALNNSPFKNSYSPAARQAAVSADKMLGVAGGATLAAATAALTAPVLVPAAQAATSFALSTGAAGYLWAQNYGTQVLEKISTVGYQGLKIFERFSEKFPILSGFTTGIPEGIAQKALPSPPSTFLSGYAGIASSLTQFYLWKQDEINESLELNIKPSTGFDNSKVPADNTYIPMRPVKLLETVTSGGPQILQPIPVVQQK